MRFRPAGIAVSRAGHVLVGACIGWAGCTGTIAPGVGDEGVSPGGGARAGSSAAIPGQGGAAGSFSEPLAPGQFSTSPGLRRLTQTEYVHAVTDLLGVSPERAALPRELVVHGHGQIAGAQRIGYDDSNKYLEAADAVAARAAAGLVTQAGCSGASAATCWRDFARNFLLRAFRAPPDAAVLDRYAGILTSTDMAAGATAQDRMATFLVAVLTSPHFLYRKEVGQPIAGKRDLRALSGYEVASRLSFLLWQSGPDTTLLEAAASGALDTPAGRTAQLQRMLEDPRARRGLRAFVSDWMALFDNPISRKATVVLEGTGPGFADDAQRAFDLLVDDVLSGPGAKLTDLLTAEHAFANAAVATVMGAQRSGAASDFTRVSLDTSARRGILTQPLVIAAHSKEQGASPFPIGAFIYENVLCEEVPPPPQVFPDIEDTTSSEQTLRQRLEAMTQGAACIGCHSRIGPPGFAFLPFDPVGRFSRNDAAGRPFDTTGRLLIEGQAPLPFDGAADLSAKLAQAPAAQRCLGTRMFRFAYGRFEAPAEASALRALQDGVVGTGVEVVRLLDRLVASADFSQVRVQP